LEKYPQRGGEREKALETVSHTSSHAHIKKRKNQQKRGKVKESPPESRERVATSLKNTANGEGKRFQKETKKNPNKGWVKKPAGKRRKKAQLSRESLQRGIYQREVRTDKNWKNRAVNRSKEIKKMRKKNDKVRRKSAGL